MLILPLLLLYLSLASGSPALAQRVTLGTAAYGDSVVLRVSTPYNATATIEGSLRWESLDSSAVLPPRRSPYEVRMLAGPRFEATFVALGEVLRAELLVLSSSVVTAHGVGQQRDVIGLVFDRTGRTGFRLGRQEP